MARRGLIGAALLIAGSAVVACETRSVFLVPTGSPLEGTGGTMMLGDAGRGGTGGFVMFPSDDAGTPTCETKRNPEQPQPLGVYLMVDQSQAMKTQWTAVQDALSQFITESERLGQMSVGLAYYGITPSEPDYQSTVCHSESYRAPVVAIAPLPGNAKLLLDSIPAHGPTILETLFHLVSDESPIDAALTGAIQGAGDWARANAVNRSKPVVLLVTDGVPAPDKISYCMPLAQRAIDAATLGTAGDPRVTTYVLNVGAPNTDLDSIAVAGGSEHAYSAANASDMLAALQSIRELALPCEVSADAKALQRNELNVELSGPEGTTRFGQVSVSPGATTGNVRACKPQRTNEWYTEGSGDLATVHLCPDTCAYARSVKDAILDVVLGCATTHID